MTRIFNPDPVTVQKGRVLAAHRVWLETRASINDPASVPARLDELIAIAVRIASPIEGDVILSLDALIIEFEGLQFSGDPDETMRGIEEKTLLVQAALGNLRRAAEVAGYGNDEEELPERLRVPSIVLADKLEALEKSIRQVQSGVEKIAEAQREDQANNQPPLQAPLVENFIRRVDIKLDFSLVKLSGKMIDISGLTDLVKETRKLVSEFNETASQIVLATHWLRKSVGGWLKKPVDVLGAATADIVGIARKWVLRRTGTKPHDPPDSEISASRPEDVGTPPRDFDPVVVHDMILRGEAPPQSWAPHIFELDFFAKKFSSLASLAPLKNLTSLTTLDLRDTQVSDLAPLKDLTSLTTLDLMNTQVSDLAPLKDLTSLTTLDLRNTQVSDFKPLQGLLQLKDVIVEKGRVAPLAKTLGRNGVVKFMNTYFNKLGG